MDTLPLEVVSQILLYLPRDSYPTLRSTCHIFNAVLGPALFTHLRGFLDLRAAENQVARGSNNPLLRPVTIWSPESWPPADFALSPNFLSALYCALAYEPWNVKGGELDGDNFGVSVSRTDLTKSKLQQIQFLYEMYLEYAGSDISMLDSRTAATLEMMVSYPNMLPKDGVTAPFLEDDDMISEVVYEDAVSGWEDMTFK